MKNLKDFLEKLSNSFQASENLKFPEMLLVLTIFFGMILCVVISTVVYYDEDIPNPKRKGLFVARAIFSLGSGLFAFLVVVFSITSPIGFFFKNFPVSVAPFVVLLIFVSKDIFWQKRPIVTQAFFICLLVSISVFGFERLPFLIYISSGICLVSISWFAVKRGWFLMKKIFSIPEKYWFKH